ncbi:MAG: hypothetical protein EOP08_06995 [Proteobacteria bacterium]|nr:MAG: hypothetical protein EOP08_06995 [Pseudomonadota bacterium]
MATPKPNPFINGNRYGWGSIELGIAGVDQEGFTAISYKASQDVGKVRGKGHRKKARTKGESDSTGSLTLLKKDANKLYKVLGPGFMTGNNDFPITVNYSENAEDEPITDTLKSCRIIDINDDPQQGSEPLTVTLELDIGSILYDGIDPQE